MKQYEAVIEALEKKGGIATFGELYQIVDTTSWGTKTPQATIRRIVQERKEIFKIRPGLWALEKYRHNLPAHMQPKEALSPEQYELYSHYYFQGLLVEIGKLRAFHPYIPAQDKNRPFRDGITLGDISQLKQCPEFTYPSIIQDIKSIDVIWFVNRGNDKYFPYAVYEVEHTSDFKTSLIKFVELQDFYANFWIVADERRRDEYEDKVQSVVFNPIAKRVKFLSYDTLSSWYDEPYKYTV